VESKFVGILNDAVNSRDYDKSMKLCSCFSQFKSLLEYVSPKSLQNDLEKLIGICINKNLSDDQRLGQVGNLFFKRYEASKELDGTGYPDAFDELNRSSRSFQFSAAFEDLSTKARLKKMFETFRGNLVKAVAIDREIAKILMSYLLFSLMAHEKIGPQDAYDLIPLSEVSTETGVSQEYYYKQLIALNLPEYMNDSCISIISEYLVPPVLQSEIECRATNQDSGETGGVSTLTNDQST